MRRTAAFLTIAALLAAPAAVFAHEEVFTAELSADAEVPAPDVPGDFEGGGSATFTINEDHTEISYEVTYENLTGPLQASHIHWGAEGEAGPIILPLDSGADAGASGSFSGTLTEADFQPAEGGPQSFAEALDAMREGNTYVNLHTEQNPPGEIRGQLVMEDEGAEPTPPPTSTSEIAGSSGTPPPIAVLLLLVGLAAFVVALRRFSLSRA